MSFEVCSAAKLQARATEVVTTTLRAALERAPRASFVLAGGSSPRGLYERLSSASPDAGPDWSRVDFFFGDERCVPPDDAASNYAMARESLLDPLEIASTRVHRMRGESDPAEEAARYESEIRRSVSGAPPRLDLVLLGMGADGHTASLFPDSPALDSAGRLVVPAQGPAPHLARLTMTLDILNAAQRVIFLVAGSEKAAALARVRSGDESLPAARIRPCKGVLSWLVDRAAAGEE